MKNVTMIAAAALSLGLSGAAFADTLPEEGTTCISGCFLPNNNWGLGDPVVGDTETKTHTAVDTSSEVINMATLKSGGRASEKNQSNFRTEVITTTVTTYEITTTTQDHLNPGNNNVNNQPGEGPKTVIEVDYIGDPDVTVEYGDREHVHPHE